MECIFCDIVTKKASSWMIYQDEYISAFFDYFPASKWHVMIVPNKHYANIFEIPDDILSKISSLSKKISIFYKENLWIENINIIQSELSEYATARDVATIALDRSFDCLFNK